MIPIFTPGDLAEADRLNRRLERMPRVRMETMVGRFAWNLVLRVVEVYPLLHKRAHRIPPELREVEALGRCSKLRIFRPPGPCRGVVLDFHGGGWTIGNARMADDLNSEFALRLGVTIVSVDYQLALSATVGDVIDESEAALSWTVAHAGTEFGSDRLVVHGSSAGSHLAASALIRLRDRDPSAAAASVAGLVLYFGLYDFAGTPMVRDAGDDTLILHGPTVRATLHKLTPGMTDDERRSPALSPLYADLTGLPPALFVVGGKDILLEDNQRMAARWSAANGNSELLVVPDSPHAFMLFKTEIRRKVGRFVDEWIVGRMRGAVLGKKCFSLRR